jgi:hypothetical protein
MGFIDLTQAFKNSSRTNCHVGPRCQRCTTWSGFLKQLFWGDVGLLVASALRLRFHIKILLLNFDWRMIKLL